MWLPNTLWTANRTFLQDKYKKNPMQDEILSVLQTQQTVDDGLGNISLEEVELFVSQQNPERKGVDFQIQLLKNFSIKNTKTLENVICLLGYNVSKKCEKIIDVEMAIVLINEFAAYNSQIDNRDLLIIATNHKYQDYPYMCEVIQSLWGNIEKINLPTWELVKILQEVEEINELWGAIDTNTLENITTLTLWNLELASIAEYTKELNDKRVLARLIQMSPLEKQTQVTKALEAFGYKVGNFMKLTVH